MTNGDRIIRAMTSEDGEDLARYYLTQMSTKELHDLAIDLSQRVPALFSRDNEVLADIVTTAASMFGVDVKSICSGVRRREVVEARQVSCYAGHLHSLTYSHMGRRIGRDHTTVMAAVVRVRNTPRLRHIAEQIAGSFGWDREAS